MSTWLDFVDTPLVYYLDGFFFEPFPGEYQTATEQTRTGPFVFPWKDVSERLAQASRDDPFGTRVQLGEPAFPSMALYMEKIRAGERIPPYRTTASRQYCVVEGKGRSIVEGLEFEWSRSDVFVAPCWSRQEHVAEEDAVLFVMTDEPLQRYLRLFRAQAAPHDGPRPLSLTAK
jgi:gentisate 1,2-dioxygenase